MFSETRFILSESLIDTAQLASEGGLAWVDLLAKDTSLPRLHKVPGHSTIIISLNDQSLPITHMCAQLECFPEVFHGRCRFTLIGRTHCVVSRCEIRVELDGSLPKRQRGRRITIHVKSLPTQTVCLQCFERRCSRLFERCVVFLHGT